MANKNIPEDLMDELLKLSEELNEWDDSYVSKLKIVLANFNEGRFYEWAKADLEEYIMLFSIKPGMLSANETDRLQYLGKKLNKAKVILDSVYFPTVIDEGSQEVIQLSQERTNAILKTEK